MRVVLDTSVLVASARSKTGASFALVNSIPTGDFELCLSVGLYCEWLAVLQRPENLPPGLTQEEARGFVRYLASHSHLQEVHFLWRPFLPDPNDDMILELAFAARCPYIITHNVRDFVGAPQFGVEALTPGEFLNTIKTST